MNTASIGYTIRNCNNCDKEYKADNRNLNRGWGLCCSKSCAASLREKSKPGYDPKRVAKNNAIRASFYEQSENCWGEKFRGYTSEGYRIFGHTAYNEWDEPVYDLTGEEDPGDSLYWCDKDY